MPFVVAFVIALVLTPAAARVAIALRLVDAPDQLGSEAGSEAGALKIHARSVPVLGGVAVTVAALVAPLALGRGPGGWVIAAVAVALSAGVADDARPLPPWVRVQLQILAGLLLAAGGLRFGPDGAPGIVAVVVLTLACTNAVNLIDGQDGLAAGLGAIAAAGLAFLVEGDTRALGLAASGALAGFLLWNRPPARIFLGNGGAYSVGVVLAALVASATGSGAIRGAFAAGACLAVFAFDLATTVVRRAATGAALTEGDRRHVYDLLAIRLRSRTQSTLVMWSAGVAAAVAGLWIGR